MMKKLSLTARLTLIFTTLSCAVLLVLGWLIGMSIERHFEEQDHHTLSGKLELAHHIIERVESDADLKQLAGQLDDALVGHHDLVIRVTDHQNTVLLSSGDIQFPTEFLNSAKKETHQHDTHLFTWTQNGTQYRGLVRLFETKQTRFNPITVAIATDIAHHQSFMQTFRKTLWLFVLVAAVVTGMLAWIAASSGLRPLRSMRERAAAVTASKLDQRLDMNDVPPELADLTQSLNQMLARLEKAFQRLSDFSSDLAHELRTPINNLMMQTQVALSKERDANTYREILESNAEEYSHLARMISDMLFLAKAENGMSLSHLEKVDLVAEVQHLFEFYEALAEELQVNLVLQEDSQDCQRCENADAFSIQGDRLMLRRALSNLISNALRYTAPMQTITVHLCAKEQQIELTVSNPGATIAAHHLPRLFERFYRVDPSLQHGEGSGLGLAIVQAIVQEHGGEINVQSREDVTRFCMVFTRSSV